MHPAVDLLLKRMESNPEEFVNPHQKNRRWEIIMEKYKGYMKEEERETVKKKYSELQMDACHKEIMAELLREPQQETGKQLSLPLDQTTTVSSSFYGTNDTRQMKNELKEILKQHIRTK